MSLLMVKLLNEKLRNEGVVNQHVKPIRSSAPARWARKEREEYIQRMQAHTHHYWTRETMLEAIVKFLEGSNFEEAQTMEIFGGFSDERLMRYFKPLPEEYQPQGASTSDDELLIAPDTDLVHYWAMEQKFSRRGRR